MPIGDAEGGPRPDRNEQVFEGSNAERKERIAEMVFQLLELSSKVINRLTKLEGSDSLAFGATNEYKIELHALVDDWRDVALLGAEITDDQYHDFWTRRLNHDDN